MFTQRWLHKIRIEKIRIEEIRIAQWFRVGIICAVEKKLRSLQLCSLQRTCLPNKPAIIISRQFSYPNNFYISTIITMSEEILIRLHLVRLKAKQHDIEKRIEVLNSKIIEEQSHVESKSKTLNNVRLTSQLIEFVKLNEHYAETLELIAEQARQDSSLLACSAINSSPIQDTIGMDDGRCKKAMELFAELMGIK